jgi:hypothetical protein
VFGPAVLFTVINLILSLRKNVPSEPNPWDSKELEWTGNYSETELEAQQTISSNTVSPVSDSAGNPENSTLPEKETMK